MVGDDAPVVVDLFSGAGGLSLGFAAAGCVINAAVDIDTAAGNTFRKNFSRFQPDHAPEVIAGDAADMQQFDLERVPGGRQPDILIGGPPCQAFSRIGRGKLDSLSDEGFVGDPRNRLYRRFHEAVELWRPKAVVMENVTGMLSVAGTNYASIVTKELADHGYFTGYAVLNAVWYGVPQFRERLFFVAIRDDLGIRPAAPPTTHQATLPEGYLRPCRDLSNRITFGDLLWDRVLGELSLPRLEPMRAAVTVGEAIGDLPGLTDHQDGSPLPRGNFRNSLSYAGEALSPYAQLMRSWGGLSAPLTINDHVTRRTPRDYELFRRMKPGDRYPDALKLAKEHEEKLFEARLRLMDESGEAPAAGSKDWKKLRARFVPPYDRENFLDKWRKLYPNQPSWTVPAHLGRDSYSHIHYDGDQARMITPREAARLQSFPDTFEFEGSMGDCFRQIGNAVPPILAWALAHQLLRSLHPCDEGGGSRLGAHGRGRRLASRKVGNARATTRCDRTARSVTPYVRARGRRHASRV
jgi:DNA (cytosine-5)-methyltransferase 1